MQNILAKFKSKWPVLVPFKISLYKGSKDLNAFKEFEICLLNFSLFSEILTNYSNYSKISNSSTYSNSISSLRLLTIVWSGSDPIL